MNRLEQYGAGLALLGAGALVGSLLERAALKREYDARANRELELAREHYRRVYKLEEFSDPEQLAKNAGYEVGETSDPTLEEAIAALAQYTGRPIEPVGETVVEGVDLEDQLPEVEEQLKADEANGRLGENLFAAYSDKEWDYEVEMSKRTNGGGPYVIHVDEFNANENEYEQAQLTYYEGDGVLADMRDDPIPAIDKVVGEGNLFRFGHGGADENTVYVRNEQMEMEWEITKSDGKFAQVVLGILSHGDDYMPRRKRRLED